MQWLRNQAQSSAGRRFHAPVRRTAKNDDETQSSAVDNLVEPRYVARISPSERIVMLKSSSCQEMMQKSINRLHRTTVFIRTLRQTKKVDSAAAESSEKFADVRNNDPLRRLYKTRGLILYRDSSL